METKREWQHQLIVLTISFLAGWFGLDRFYQGQIGWGILKMITCGGVGVWYLVDVAIAAYKFGKVT